MATPAADAAPPLTCRQALRLYQDHLFLRGRNRGTIDTYTRSITTFYAFLTRSGKDPAETPIAAITIADIAAFLLEAARNDRKPATRAAYLTALSAFLRHLSLNRHYPLSVPALKAHLGELSVKLAFGRPAPDQRLPALVRHVDQAAAAAAPGRARLLAARDRAILQVLFASGMRVSEVASLSRNDIDWEHAQATILGKGNRHRMVFFSPEALAATNAYLDLRGDDGFTPLFLHHDNAHARQIAAERATKGTGESLRLNPRRIQSIIRTLARQHDIRATPHTFRHYVATELLNDKGADIRDVQDILGHASITTTQIYTHKNAARLAATAARRFTPTN